MKPLLQHLENESLLLLYMAGELPLADREELETMLERDGGLRSQLQSLRQAQAVSFSGLQQLDLAEHLQAVEPAMRRVNRSIRQWNIDRMARPAKALVARSKLPILAWSIGSAVAALLVFCIWWGLRADVNPHMADSQRTTLQPADSQPTNALQLSGDRLAESVPPPSVAPVAGAPVAGAPSDNPDMPETSGPMVQIVTVDNVTQQLGDLENTVREDFTSSSRE